MAKTRLAEAILLLLRVNAVHARYPRFRVFANHHGAVKGYLGCVCQYLKIPTLQRCPTRKVIHTIGLKGSTWIDLPAYSPWLMH